ncbi:hypothetical protein BDZ45DRAFT_682498 [Acephala macrosclerotiorum]|nr:hypothetical protein BDZ45DRAFT_682498 [Acephala macrosclerotiorum]
MSLNFDHWPRRPSSQHRYLQFALKQCDSKLNHHGAPISPVELQENYDCGTSSCPAGYDGLHPNALGEY